MKTLAPSMALLVVVSLTASCDDKNAVPASVQQAAVKAQAEGPKGPARPTTQELMSGSRKRLVLAPLPFSVRVPTPWKVDSLGGGSIIVLGGPTPSGEAQIQLTTRSPAKKEELEVIQRAAKKELSQPTTDSSKKTVKAEFRKLGDIEIFERQAVGQPGPLTITDDKGQERIETATPYTWTLTMFIPQGSGDYARHEMNFIGLTAEQYKQDQPLLDDILKSLNHEAAAAPATLP